MRVLALETTDKLGSVAALDDDKVIQAQGLSRSQRSAQSLIPATRTLLENIVWRPQEVELVGVSIGPGSFTGLRVGVTAAKVFAFAVGADILAVNTLEAIAAAVPDQLPAVYVAMDAQRGDVIVQSFVRKQPSGPVQPLGPQQLLPAEAWLAGLPEGAVVTGPALTRLVGDDPARPPAAALPAGVRALDRRYWFPRAETVGRLAFRYHAAGRRDDIWKLVPHYFRRSAAEEKWDALGK
jgi:tRNA threonylcarbamoyladenosine biosynthesis protein TsaB